MPDDPARENFDDLVNRVNEIEAATAEQVEAKNRDAEFHAALAEARTRRRRQAQAHIAYLEGQGYSREEQLAAIERRKAREAA